MTDVPEMSINAGIRLKVSFQFFTDENLKKTEQNLWQSVLGLIPYHGISLDWPQGLRHLKKGTDSILVNSVQAQGLNHIIPHCPRSMNRPTFNSFPFINTSFCAKVALCGGTKIDLDCCILTRAISFEVMKCVNLSRKRNT